MTDWMTKLDFGVVHPLVYFECRAGAGPIMETLPVIVNDSDFGAIEIAPIKDPAVRKQARDLLASAQMQVVYLPILPIIVEDLKIASADQDERAAVRSRMKALIDEALEFASPLAMITGPRDPGPEGRAAATERLVEDLQELCDYAAAKSSRRLLHITFEHFDRDIEKNLLIGRCWAKARRMRCGWPRRTPSTCTSATASSTMPTRRSMATFTRVLGTRWGAATCRK